MNIICTRSWQQQLLLSPWGQMALWGSQINCQTLKAVPHLSWSSAVVSCRTCLVVVQKPQSAPTSYVCISWCAKSCCSRWSPLFGSGPDHVTTKWWKLWAVCKLSISIERLEAGSRQGTWKYIHALRRRRTEIPEPQKRWVDGFYLGEGGDKKKRKKGYALFFFFTASRQEAREREGLLASALWSYAVLGKWILSKSASSVEDIWCWVLLFCIIGLCINVYLFPCGHRYSRQTVNHQHGTHLHWTGTNHSAFFCCSC